jgi:type I restriction enzyme M protein
MTPKGGIRPHKRFQIQANRSEVLFVDYIMEHIATDGRAGVIVPEGIIFQSGNAYKMLRKTLVNNNYLYAVVSLPAGVFNPYSGVKTSILLMDRTLAKKTNDILFIKIENDGFDLGAQRREIDKNDLPDALDILQKYKQALQEGKKFKISESEKELAHTVLKEKIAESGDFNLTGDRYRERIIQVHKHWPMVELGDIAEFVRGPFGSSIKRSVCVPKGNNTFKVYEQGNVIQNDFARGDYYITKEKYQQLKRFAVQPGDILVTCAGTIGRMAIVPEAIEDGIINSVLMRIRVREELILKTFFVFLFQAPQIQNKIAEQVAGVAIKNMFATSELKKFKVPLPPISVQQKIINEIEKEHERIEDLKKQIENHEQKIKTEIAEIWG